MRITHYIIYTVALAVLAMGSTVWAGGGNRVGTAGADQLLMPVGARGVALGSSFLAGISGVNAIYYNPAGLSASTSRAEVMFSHSGVLNNEVGVDYAAVGANFAGFGTLGFSVKSLSFGDIPITTETAPDGTGATYSPTFVTIGLTYSRSLTDRIRAGITASLVSETIDRVSSTGTSFDIGIQYQGLAGYRGLQLGVALRHLGGNLTYRGPGLTRTAAQESSNRGNQLFQIQAAEYSLPTSLELGLAYTTTFAEMHGLTVSGAFENNNFLTDQFRIGAEYSFKNFLYVRASWSVPDEDPKDVSDKSSYLYGPAFGVGLNYASGDLNLGLDYAFRVSDIYDGAHFFTLNIGF